MLQLGQGSGSARRRTHIALTGLDLGITTIAGNKGLDCSCFSSGKHFFQVLNRITMEIFPRLPVWDHAIRDSVL